MKKAILGIVLSLAAGSASSYASVLYSVNVDTHSLSGQSGIIDFAFLAGNTDADAALASVAAFATSGTLSGAATIDGTVLPGNASLPGSFAISNDPGQQLNDLYQSIVFGNSLSFSVTLSGPAFDSPNAADTSGSTFSFSLYQPNFAAPLLTSSVDGSVLDLQVSPGGSVAAQTFTTDLGGASVVSAAPVVAATPEPETNALVGVGLLSLALLGRWRRARN
jgi:hypothetical protein